jgi:hypothetical protein
MCEKRTSSDSRTMEVVIEATVIQIVESLADLTSLMKEESRLRARAEERAQAVSQELQAARQLLERRALAISRLDATWRELTFARNVQRERADKLQMQLASVDNTLHGIETRLGIDSYETTTAGDYSGRIRALVIEMAALVDKQRQSAGSVDSDASTATGGNTAPPSEDTGGSA